VSKRGILGNPECWENICQGNSYCWDECPYNVWKRYRDY
jgi:Fe-S-cluster-containing dehydrogenase component